jgi:Tol biopolymer transport system component
MSKKQTILIIILAVFVAGVFGYQYFKRVEEKQFLSQLKGEIVFARRDNGVLNIYKINANGTGLRMLYHNEENNSAYLPEWSESGEKVYFATLKEGKVQTFAILVNVGEVRKADEVEKQERRRTREQLSRAENIVVKNGAVFWRDRENRLHKIYRILYYNYKLNPGPSEVSWSPDGKYIIFETCTIFKGCRIMIADKQGRVAELTKGQQPDWKY